MAVTTAAVAVASAAVVDIAGKFCTVSKLVQRDREASNWMPPFFVHGALGFHALREDAMNNWGIARSIA